MYREHSPAPELRRHVACYWTIRSGEPGRPRRVLPDGSLDLLFNFGDPIDPEGGRANGVASVVGIMTRALLTRARGKIDLLGVRFRPGEATAFLAFPATLSRDVAFALDDVWGRPGANLAERLAEQTGDARLRLLDRELLGRLARARFADRRVRAAILLVEEARGTLSIASVCDRVGLGERQLERAFQERVGLGPKALARVVRLQSLVSTLDALGSSPAPWSRIAADLGYADQAHLVREVRSLAGVTPGALLRERAPAMSVSFNPAEALVD